MVKSMLLLCYLFSPHMALRIQKTQTMLEFSDTIGKDDEEIYEKYDIVKPGSFIEKNSLSMDFVDLEVGLSEPEKALMNDHSRTESILRKVSGVRNHAWIVFMGDSNMRNTYYWYVMQKLKPKSVKFMQSKQFGRFYRPHADKLWNASLTDDDEWSDQEAIVTLKDDFEVRASFRFLHGANLHGVNGLELNFKTRTWNRLTRASQKGKEETITDEEYKKGMDDPNALVPSKYAQFAAAHQVLIDVKTEVPEMWAKFKEYDHPPHAVILTEGWGGTPGCTHFQEILRFFRKSPETKFVWSPIYATNRGEARHRCFEQQIAAVPEPDKENYRFVEMWDVAQKQGIMPQESEMKNYIKHVPMGGTYMKIGCKRFEDAIDALVDKEVGREM